MKAQLTIASLVAGGLLALAAAPASAQTFTLTATLTGGNETPAPGINTGAFGSATVKVDMATRTITYSVQVFNLPSGVAASHIHVGALGTPGPIIFNFAPPLTASNDFSYAGTLKDTDVIIRADQGIRSADDAFQAILGGNTYVNVHSQANPAGEIRGQLVLKQ